MIRVRNRVLKNNFIITMSSYMIRNIYYLNFQSCVRNGISLWGGDKESNEMFTFQKKIIQIISSVSNTDFVNKYLKIAIN
jgi:hypothetical protein